MLNCYQLTSKIHHNTTSNGILVIAKDEASARRIANREYGLGVKAPAPGQNFPLPFWLNPDSVACIKVDCISYIKNKEGEIINLD